MSNTSASVVHGSLSKPFRQLYIYPNVIQTGQERMIIHTNRTIYSFCPPSQVFNIPSTTPPPLLLKILSAPTTITDLSCFAHFDLREPETHTRRLNIIDRRNSALFLLAFHRKQVKVAFFVGHFVKIPSTSQPFSVGRGTYLIFFLLLSNK